MPSNPFCSRLVTIVDRFKTRLINFRASVAQSPVEISDAMEGFLPHAVAGGRCRYTPNLNNIQANVSPCRIQQVVTGPKYGSMETSAWVTCLPRTSFQATTDAYNHHLSKTPSIDDDSINFIGCTVRSGSVSVARVPIITTDHPAMHVTPMSAVVDLWEREEQVGPSSRIA
ncbi:unnamed protein product [Rhizoctonia solani]|uniref:Uncharacterized protein n=1 Tax=Rhizoctonia solani TaxID=456999 RepID=A0A8H3A9Q3_9AGAM|nr:unnamed protein product [Rhizoctonia solani]